MQKYDLFALFKKLGISRKSMRKDLPKTSLQLEVLEERQLLSVTPIEYAELRELYSSFSLPSEMSQVNVIELTDLTAESLQNAINKAAETTQDDLIVVRTDAESKKIEIEKEQIEINIDPITNGKLTFLSLGEERLQISVNSEAITFDVRSGSLYWGGIDFINVSDVQLICRLSTTLAIKAYDPEWTDFNTRYFDVQNIDITEQCSPDYQLQQNLDNIDLYFSEKAEVGNSFNGNITTNVTSNNDYVVIFMGGVDARQNYNRYYNTLVSFYSKLTTTLEINPNNIYILYANGDTTGTSFNRNENEYNNPSYKTSNMSFATTHGTSVKSATFNNLFSDMGTIAGKMKDSSHLLLYTYDHGDGEYDKKLDTADYLCGWGENITSKMVRDSLYQVQKGYVTAVFGQCFSGGILDDLFTPSSGSQIMSYDDRNGDSRTYTGTAKFYGMAATNHYEYSLTFTFMSSYVGFAQSFIKGLTRTITTEESFNYVKKDNFYTSGESYERNEGNIIVDEDGDQCREHPWSAGSTFSVLADVTPTKPDLAFDTPSLEVGYGWSDSVFISNQSTATSGLTSFTTNDTLYINYAYVSTKTFTSTSPVYMKVYDGSTQIDSTSETTFDSTQFYCKNGISLGKLSAGTHMIKVVLDATDVVSESDEYNNSRTITINITPNITSYDFYEPNDSFSTAFNLGSFSSRTISSNITPNDYDWFKFTLDSTGTTNDKIIMTYIQETGSVDLNMYLCDSDNNYLVGSDASTGTESISLFGYAAGTYYLNIYNVETSISDIPYTLKFDANPSLLFDINGDGIVTSGIDVTMLLRYLGNSNAKGVVAGLNLTNGTRTNKDEKYRYIQDNFMNYDVNGDGVVTSGLDVNMILRYLGNANQKGVVVGLNNSSGTRDPSAIYSYLQSACSNVSRSLFPDIAINTPAIEYYSSEESENDIFYADSNKRFSNRLQTKDIEISQSFVKYTLEESLLKNESLFPVFHGISTINNDIYSVSAKTESQESDILWLSNTENKKMYMNSAIQRVFENSFYQSNKKYHKYNYNTMTDKIFVEYIPSMWDKEQFPEDWI